MIPLIGFAPDADPTTPGVIVDCEHLIPFEAGMKGAPSATSVGVDALAAACVGIVATSDLTGSRRLIAGTAAELYEVSGSSWTNRSRAASYTLAADTTWTFTQNGNATIAANASCVLQRSVSGDFADISGSPQAQCVESAKGFVLAFNTTTSSDEWYCSAYLDDTDWTLALGTQCTSGRLIGGSGPIEAARRFQDDVIAYKGGAMFHGRYVGTPSVWDWQQVSTDVGCVGPGAVADTPIGHIFVSRDGIYLYDGTTPRPLGDGIVRNWLMGEIAPTLRYKTVVVWDRINHIVRIMYASIYSPDGGLDASLVYHPKSQRWGRDNNAAQAAVNYTTPSLTYNGSSPLFANYDDATTALSYDSRFWIDGIQLPAIINGSNSIQTLSGPCAASTLTTGVYGDDQGYSMCRDLRFRFSLAPTTATATGYSKVEATSTYETGGAVSLPIVAARTDGKFDFRVTARWHQFKLNTTGDYKVTALRPELVSAGDR